MQDIHPDRDMPLTPRCTLYGHDGAVRSVAANAELDTIISGSEDGTILVYSLREGFYIRCIDIKSGPRDASLPIINRSVEFYYVIIGYLRF
jgi:WD40 repeat protein